MFLWVDDIRTPPCDKGLWARSVSEAITAIKSMSITGLMTLLLLVLTMMQATSGQMEGTIFAFWTGSNRQEL